MYDLLIIGAGPAGLSATIYAGRLGLKTCLIEKGVPGGKMMVTAEIENWPGDTHISGFDLSNRMFEHASSYQPDYHMDEVKEIIHQEHYQEVICESQTYQAKTVLIASGTMERKMNIENEERYTGMGVSYCAVCDGPFFKNETVCVIGGGNSALEEALYLSTLASHVHLIVRRDVFRADALLVNRVKEKENIEIHLQKKPYRVEGDENSVTGLTIQDSQTGALTCLETQGIFPFIGLDPITGFAKQLNILDKQGYLVTHEDMSTDVPGIYGAGDVRSKVLRQVVTASNDGAIAAQSIAKYLEEQAK